MKIAFLGWSSLIWDPRELGIKGKWKEDGPYLPIEFRRYSKGGRITLVLHPDAEDVQTLWVHVDFTKLVEAIENLRAREVTLTERIGFVSIPDGTSRCNAVPNVLERIQKWAEKRDLDAVVWTDLTDNPKKFKEQTRMELTDDNIIKYLKSLEGKTLHEARKYIQNAPN